MIIAISGKKQTGKDTVANMIQFIIEHYDKGTTDSVNELYALYFFVDQNFTKTKLKKFADKLKEVTALILGTDDITLLDSEQFKNLQLPITWMRRFDENNKMISYYDLESVQTKFQMLTYREALQIIGTDCLRNHFHPDIWVITTLRDYKDDEFWVISDCRFRNEAEAVKSKGGILLRIERDNIPFDNHSSENDLDNYEGFDYVIHNNGLIKTLFYQVFEFLKEFKIIG